MVEQKLLVLIRHAKSSWADPTLSDFERPLNKRGKRDVPVMGKRLKKRGVMPDLFLSSPAKRARKTARKIGKALGMNKGEIVLDQTLYHASDHEMLEIIRSTSNTVDTIFIVGHNFTLTDIACDLADIDIDNIPTCGMVGICFTGRWKDIEYGDGNLQFFDYPKKRADTCR